MSAVYELFPSQQEKPREDLNAAFERFWSIYPKRTQKALAKAKFMAICRGSFKTKTRDKDSGGFMDIELDASAEEIIEGAKRYMDSLIDKVTWKRKIEDKYIPAAAVWLNQGRWLDE